MALRLRRKRPPVAPGGEMTLVEHLIELRSRIFKVVLAIVAGTVLAWMFYEPILAWLTAPYMTANPQLQAKGIDSELVVSGIGGAFQFQLRISLMAGLVMSSPVWIWQLWAFILPALHQHERRAALFLTATCTPLFIGGAWMGYYVFPKAIELLVGFAPEGWTNLLEAGDYLTFATRMMLLFGVGAQIPVVVIILNRIGAVSGRQLVRARPWTIIGIFVFAAFATPTVDPVTFLFLALPMTTMYLVAETIARLSDRKKERAVERWSDDEASALDPADATPLSIDSQERT